MAAIQDLPPFIGWLLPPAEARISSHFSAPSAPPALITTTRYDVVPTGWATAMQAALGKGTYMVTYEGVGHVNAESAVLRMSGPDDPCTYLVTPTTPPATYASCAAVSF